MVCLLRDSRACVRVDARGTPETQTVSFRRQNVDSTGPSQRLPNWHTGGSERLGLHSRGRAFACHLETASASISSFVRRTILTAIVQSSASDPRLFTDFAVLLLDASTLYSSSALLLNTSIGSTFQ